MGFRVEIDEDACIGCGACVSEHEDNFELVETDAGFKAKAKKKKFDSDGDFDKNKAAADICPVQAIKVEKL